MHLDLDSRDDAAEAQLERLLNTLRRKKKIVVIAGAGISVSAGSKSPFGAPPSEILIQGHSN